MKKISKFFFLFFAVFIGFSSNLHAEFSGESVITVKVGSDKNYPPYEYLDNNGELTGFNVELLKNVAEVTNLDVLFIPDSWSNIRNALETGVLDMASGMFYSDARAKKINFSLPHSIVYYSLFVRTDSSIEKIEETVGKSIIVIEGDIMHDYAFSLGFKKDIVIVEDTLSAVQFLSEGRFEAALLPKVQTLHILSDSKIFNVKPAGPLMLPQEYCFAVRSDLSQVQARLDQGLNILQASGEYQKLRNKWFGILPREKYAMYFKVVGWGLISCVVMLMMSWIWNRALAKRIKIHTQDLSYELAAHRRTLSDLEKKEEQLRGVLESSSDAILALDRNRKITRCNPAFVHQFGYTMDEIIGFSTMKIHVEDSAYEQFQATVYPEVEQTGYWRGEWQYKTQKGQVLDVETSISIKRLSNGMHDGYVAVIRDITKRKKAEQERIRLATAIEQSADAILITDVSGNILFMNAAAERSSGGDRSVLLRTRLVFLQPHPDCQTDFSKVIERLSAGGVWHGKVISKDKQGRQLDEEITVSPVVDKTGLTTNYVVVKRDITQLSRLEHRLNQSRKLEAIGTLAGGIAHDFGNILTSLIGYAEMALEDDLEEESPARHDVEQILIGCFRARELVDRILTFSQRSEAPLQPLHLIPLIREALKFLKSALPESVTLECEFDCTDDLIFETPAKIYQLMVNLVTNSSQALAKTGGKIKVRVSNPNTSHVRILEYNQMVDKDILCITVEDDGSGMTPEILERIFEPYFTTRDKSGGAGLGLSVVHGIVTGLDGTIDVKSSIGAGTCFTIHFPLNRARNKQNEVDSIPLATGQETILLVDNEKNTVANMRHSLIRLGYEVVAASNIESALNIFLQDPGHFHLLIFDMESTDATGIERARHLVKAVKRVCPAMPVILCQGYDAPVMEKLNLENGFDVTLHHPLSTRQIANAVSQAIAIGKNET